MKQTGIIYKHTCLIDFKSYIGQTINKPEYRWNHGEGYKDSPYFYNAIQRYGWENFSHEILEENVPIDKLNEREQYWIKYYKSDNRQFGYNLTSGGTGKLTEEQKLHRKQKIQDWRKQNPEWCEKSLQVMQQYWIDHPEEKKKVMAKATIASKQYWEEHAEEKRQIMEKMRSKARLTNIKPVICIETNITYASAREAFAKTGIHYSNIGKVCNGKQKTAGGYHWQFIDKKEYMKTYAN